MKFLLGFITGIFTGIIGFFAWAWLAGNKMTAHARNKPPELKIRKSTPPLDLHLELRDLRSGDLVNTTVFRNKVLFLNFWEYWCAPCRFEMPSIDKLFRQAGDSNIVFAVISTDKPDSVKNDKALKDFDLPFYHLESLLPPEIDAETVPRTCVIDKNGKLVIMETGMADWYGRKVIQFLDSLKSL